jgi:hypothetical protein
MVGSVQCIVPYIATLLATNLTYSVFGTLFLFGAPSETVWALMRRPLYLLLRPQTLLLRPLAIANLYLFNNLLDTAVYAVLEIHYTRPF